MMTKADAFLKVSIAISIIVASASIGYYFAIYLPNRDAALDRERQMAAAHAEYIRKADESKIAAEKKAAADRAEATREAVQSRYQRCLRTADSNYRGDWAAACRTASDRATKNNKQCLTQSSMTKALCDSIYNLKPFSPECTLQRDVATDINTRLEREKKRCLEESQLQLQ